MSPQKTMQYYIANLMVMLMAGIECIIFAFIINGISQMASFVGLLAGLVLVSSFIYMAPNIPINFIK
jgi:hypothetical protein